MIYAKRYRWLVLLLVAPLLAWGATTLRSVIITNSSVMGSTVDSSPIGSATPSTGMFTGVGVNNYSQSTASQGGYIQWNHAATGETDFVNNRGAGAGGFQWFNTTGVPGSPLMTLNSAGTLSAVGGFSGNLSGNASTATNANYATSAASASYSSATGQFNTAPLACGANAPAYGIQVNGNALCLSNLSIQSITNFGALTNNGDINGGGGLTIQKNATINGAVQSGSLSSQTTITANGALSVGSVNSQGSVTGSNFQAGTAVGITRSIVIGSCTLLVNGGIITGSSC